MGVMGGCTVPTAMDMDSLRASREQMQTHGAARSSFSPMCLDSFSCCAHSFVGRSCFLNLLGDCGRRVPAMAQGLVVREDSLRIFVKVYNFTLG